MLELKGKYNDCKVYNDVVEPTAMSTIINLLNQPFVDGSKIRIMPDVHAGKSCVIGTTMTVHDKVCANIVGCDVGCGLLAIKLKEKRIDLPKFDSIVHKYVPCGGNVHEDSNASHTTLNVKELRCYGKKGALIREDLAYASVGTMGGSNHFIELDKDSDGNIWLVIHSGSRHLGIEVCNYYMKIAYEHLKDKYNGDSFKEKQEELIKKLKDEGKTSEIESEIIKFKKSYRAENPKIPYEYAYLEGKDFDDYIHDMKLVQSHASCNRAEMARVILKYAKLHEVERFETVHNYIDTDNMILRKGSVSAQKGEKLIISMNMRDGSLICIGKGNEDWNYSAPHGAGRLMSRSAAKENISMSDYKESMKGIYTSCVNRSTIDESAFAYKKMDDILKYIADTVEVVDVIKPIYNFKACSDEEEE